MRKILFAIIILCQSLFVGAQSIELSWTNGHLDNDQSIELWDMDTTINFPLYVANVSDTDINVLVRKTYLSMIPGSSNYFCWGQCQPEENMVSNVSVNIPAGTTDFFNFIGHYTPNGNPGTSAIRYTFFNDVNPLDSVCVTVISHSMTGLGIDDGVIPAMVSRVFPNPARDYFQLQFSVPVQDLQDITLCLLNSAGQAVKEYTINTRDSYTVDIRDVIPGIYICVIRSGMSIVGREKIVIGNTNCAN